jgi:dipeptidyl aminopeptidase/acylaminoacyl peptidase
MKKRACQLRIICWGLLLVVSLGVGAWWRWRSDGTVVTPLASPTPLSLAEQLSPELYRLTIPYLRERSYHSRLQDDGVLETTQRYTARLVHYYSDGFRINGLLALPNGDRPIEGWPLVILVHGYLNPQTYQTNGQPYRAWWQAVVNSGRLAVFKPDLRGHGESQGDPGGAYYGSDYIVDVLTARQVLGAQDEINAAAIGLWGHSMGGNVVWRALATAPDIPAISLWAGAGYTYRDLQTYRISDASYVPTSPRPTASPAANLRRQMFGAEGETVDYESTFWQVMLPGNYMAEMQGKVQVQHASDDQVVNVGYSRDLIALLALGGVDYEYWEYPSGGHNLTASFNLSAARMIDFFTTNLSPSERESSPTAMLQ